MTGQEVMITRYGEMLDMVSCLSVYRGNAELSSGSATSHRITKYEEAIAVR